MSKESLLSLMAKVPGVEKLKVAFADFFGRTFAAMPRPDVTYYPAFALLRIPEGRRFSTLDDYQLAAGWTALIYPFYRNRKTSIRKVLLEQAFPVFREWFERKQIIARHQKVEGLYALYDQTFSELVVTPLEALERTRAPDAARGRWLRVFSIPVRLRSAADSPAYMRTRSTMRG